MSYASQSGRARTNAKKPDAFAVCDRCGMWHNLIALRWQVESRGTALQNVRLLVCSSCYDSPQEQLRTIVLPPDPEPKMNARVEAFDQDETDYRALSAPPVLDPVTGIPIYAKTLRTTQDGQNRHGGTLRGSRGPQSKCGDALQRRGAKSLWHPAAVVIRHGRWICHHYGDLLGSA